MSLRDYLDTLAEGIIGDFPNRGIVGLAMDLEDFPLDSRILLPLGIIVNELLTNAMKYAFQGWGIWRFSRPGRGRNSSPFAGP